MTSDPESSFEAMLREAAELRAPSPDEVCLPVMGELLQGKYRIEERLGVGGMGAVFRAINTENGKHVAIKWLLQRSAGAAARFSLEARVAARIDHPNVVNVFDIGAHDGRYFIVMELLRGTSLRKRLAAGRMTSRELVGVMLPVLRGVRAAHAAGVIHRDLKPDNVFLCVASDGTEREPKVLDFGISKLQGPHPPSDRLTAEGTRIGTLAYMSPEQLVDAPEVDARSDIYAAGVMMYEALVGWLPFRASSHNALVLAIATQQPAPISTQAPEVDRALEDIVMRAMAKDARARPASVQLLIDELTRWQERAAITPEVSSAPTQARPRRRWSAFPVALAALATLLGAWSLTRAWSSPHDMARSPTPAKVAAVRVQRQVLAVQRDPAPPPSLELQPASMPPVSAGAPLPPGALLPRPSARPSGDQGAQVPSRAGRLHRSEL